MLKALKPLDWKKVLKFDSGEILGLDIGSFAVKLIQVKKSKAGNSITAAHIAEIEEAQLKEEAAVQMNTVKAIHECINTLKLNTKMAVCGVSGPEVAIRNFRFPQLSPDEIDSAVLLEAEQVCPLNVDSSSIDYQIMHEDEDNLEGVLVAATNRIVKNKQMMVGSASLNNVLMDVDGLALLNCFSECHSDDSSKVCAVLNVGNSYTNLAIIDDHGMPFIRDITNAGSNIISSMAKLLGQTPEQVKKQLFDSPDNGGDSERFRTVLEQACQELIRDVNGTLRYYNTRENSTKIEEVYLCGGFSLAQDFVEILNSHLSVDVLLWNPFEQIPFRVNPDCERILKEKGPAFALAAGLAMRSF